MNTSENEDIDPLYAGEQTFQTAGLEGELLHCLVAIIANEEEKLFFSKWDGYTNRWAQKPTPYSKDWSACGPIMTNLDVFPGRYYGAGESNPNKYMAGQGLGWMRGETPLIAACRGFVGKYLGKSFAMNPSYRIGLTLQDIIKFNEMKGGDL